MNCMGHLQYVERTLMIVDPEARQECFRSDPRLPAILPEVYRLADIPQPPDHHPEGDALTHTLLAVQHLPAGCDRRLAWAALLHDVGKGSTTRLIAGRIRAFGHDREGAEIAEGMLRRLGMEEEKREDIVWLIRHHMFALSWQIADLERLSRRQWHFIGDPRFPLLLDLMRVDALAAAASPAKLAQVDFYRQAHGRLAAGDGKLTS